jgi:hypothetical protein
MAILRFQPTPMEVLFIGERRTNPGDREVLARRY